MILAAITVFFIIFACTAFSFSDTMTNEDDPSEKLIVSKTAEYLKGKMRSTSNEKIKNIAKGIYDESRKYSIDYRLILAVMKVESNFRNEAISSKGARGLLQVKPSLAKYIAKDTGIHIGEEASSLHEPEKNIKIGVNYLSKLIGMFDSLASALHAYNVGPSKAKKTGITNATPSTAFTKKVINEYQNLMEILPSPLGE